MTIFEVRVPDVGAAARKIRSLAGVHEESHERLGEWTQFNLQCDGDQREELHKLAIQESWPLRELTRRGTTLEDIFIEVTHSDE